jgi:outer membrane immunogenic protein
MQLNLKSTLICIALLNGIAFTSKGHAGDLPRRNAGPAFTQAQNQLNWQGFYIGGHGAYGWGKARSADISGFAFGGQAGFNVQVDRAVFGLEGDVSYSGIDYRGFTDTFRQKWLMSGRGRIGYSYDRFLPYLTGGLAYSSNTMKGFGGKAENGHLGFVIGVGAEMMLTQNVSARVEYLHYRFGSEAYALPLATRNTSITTNALRFGLNYKF